MRTLTHSSLEVSDHSNALKSTGSGRLPASASRTAIRPSDPATPFLLLAQAGDAEAFERLMKTYSPVVRGQLKRGYLQLSPEDMEDLEQATWIAVWQSLTRFQGQSLFSTWLTAIARHTLYSWSRRTICRHTLLRQLVSDINLRQDQSREVDAVARITVREALRKVSQDERLVLHLRFFCNLSDAQIARDLNLCLGTVKGRIRRGLMKARCALALTSALRQTVGHS